MRFLLLFLFSFWFDCWAQISYSQYVNPFIGTGGHGHTFPGATTPFGMVQLSPDTRIDGSWDGCGAYHYSDSVLYGFSHTHLSGTGVSDYGDILLLPITQFKGGRSHLHSALFVHENEKASAGYYSVKLHEENVHVELTATTRVGMHRYTFPVQSQRHILLDLFHRDSTVQSEIQVESGTTISGMRRSNAWAANQVVYFVMEFSEPCISYTLGDERYFRFTGKKDTLNKIASFQFAQSQQSIIVKVGISFTSIDGARENLNKEAPHWDFNRVWREADAVWNKELSKISVTGGTTEQLKVFYTALYHCMIHPNVATDVNGDYRGMDKKIHREKGYTHYTVFSLWDTFRTLHPLFTIIDTKRTTDFIRTFLSMYKQGGRLPVWELAANETDCMIGYHSVSVIADAYAKGIRNFDTKLALEAMEKSATWNHLGLPEYIRFGHLDIEHEHESVSKTLEYAYDDWCIAEFARLIGNHEVADEYLLRAQYWKNLFDRETTFIRPRKNGSFHESFDPKEVNNNYTEANGWQYTFFVPQDIPGLIHAMGGAEKFEVKLDELFTTETATTGRHQVDITGLIGQYAHGNEPSHHMAYLYNYIGKPHKTQEKVNEIIANFYKDAPDGLIGNEDCGQMSAWLVMSALGLYPVTPGIPVYTVGTPLFEEAVIYLENGKKFVINAKNNAREHFYVRSNSFNGNQNNILFLTHNDVVRGGYFNFEMSAKPSEQQFKAEYEFPLSGKFDEQLVISPVFASKSMVFKDKMTVEIKSKPEYSIWYRLIEEGKDSTDFILYSGDIELKKSAATEARSVDTDGRYSHTVLSRYYKMTNNWSVQINSKYNPQYTAGGDEGLIDGIRGETNWRKGYWQGYQSQDFECVIDLKKKQKINEVGAGFLQDTRSWILMPNEVVFSFSTDGENFENEVVIKNTINPRDYEIQIHDLTVLVDLRTKYKYVKVEAVNFGILPAWHQGAGFDAFIFIDEVFVK
ncbi:MAG: GH92 family glycosyl hydrolase [Flavobacteriales bacterium]